MVCCAAKTGNDGVLLQTKYIKIKTKQSLLLGSRIRSDRIEYYFKLHNFNILNVDQSI